MSLTKQKMTSTLPKEPKALAALIEEHGIRCSTEYAYRRTNWLLAYHYLLGCRHFNILNYASGQVQAQFLDENNRPQFTSQELLFHINQVAGRLASMDLRPLLTQQGFTLAGQRDKAVMQIVADATYSEEDIQKASSAFAYQFACLGSCGITAHIHDHPTIGLTADLEVIHPRELFPFPMLGVDVNKAQGLMRQRYLSLPRLLDAGITAAQLKKVEEDLDIFDIEPGEIEPTVDEQSSFQHENRRASRMPTASDADKISLVLVREIWLFGPRKTVTRYIVASGDAILIDQDLSGLEVYCPIGFSRFMENGTFHGAGMFDLLFHSHRELEKLSTRLYANVANMDQYGVLVLPQGQMQQNAVLKPVGDGLKVMHWQPDPIAEGFNPFSIQPVNSGDVPGRTAQYAREAMSRVNPIQDIIQEKGRVDSASGLAFLDEQMNRALTMSTAGVRDAWVSMYRGTATQALRSITTTKRPIPVGSLTLDLAGAIINFEEGTIAFPDNRIPDVARLTFNIRALSPKSMTARKQEALDLWAKGLETDPTAFKLAAISEGLDFPIWLAEEKGAYEMAIRSILMLYNDGQSPGELVLTPATTRPDIFARVLSGFSSGPALASASPEVVDAFSMLRSTLMQFQGPVLPGNMPNPDDLATLSAGTPSTPPQGPR